MDKVASALGLVVIGILVTIFGGYVITELWHWFIVPFGIMEISIAHGIGINLLISLFTFRPNMALNDELKGWGLLFVIFAVNLLFWGLGAVVHLFM